MMFTLKNSTFTRIKILVPDIINCVGRNQTFANKSQAYCNKYAMQ